MKNRKITLNHVNMSEALRYLGYGDTEPDQITKELLSVCEEDLLKVINPQYTYKVFDLDDKCSMINAEFELKGQAIKKHLSGCNKAVFMCVTLSGGVDQMIRRKQIGNMAQAVIADSMASALVEQVCDIVEGFIKEDFSDYEMTWRFGLGYEDFPLEGQKQFLDILDAPKRVGVCVNESFMLTPTKSVTCIIGLGHNLVNANKKNCDACNFRENCAFRKKGESCGR